MSDADEQVGLGLDDSRLLSFDEAASRLGLTRHRIEQLTKIAREIPYIHQKGGRTQYFIDEDALEAWRESRQNRTVTLNEKDYQESLEFALKSFYSEHTRSDFHTSTRRDAGKFVTDFVRGKLGEIGFARYMERVHQLRIGLDFEPNRSAAVGQDITEVKRIGGSAWNPPRLHVAVKTTKEYNAYLLVPEQEVDSPDRQSDAYVLVRVGMSPDHLLRMLRGHSAFSAVRPEIPEFEAIQAEMAGFAWRSELAGEEPVEELESISALAASNYARRSGDLHRSPSKWRRLAEQMVTKEPPLEG